MEEEISRRRALGEGSAQSLCCEHEDPGSNPLQVQTMMGCIYDPSNGEGMVSNR